MKNLLTTTLLSFFACTAHAQITVQPYASAGIISAIPLCEQGNNYIIERPHTSFNYLYNDGKTGYGFYIAGGVAALRKTKGFTYGITGELGVNHYRFGAEIIQTNPSRFYVDRPYRYTSVYLAPAIGVGNLHSPVTYMASAGIQADFPFQSDFL